MAGVNRSLACTHQLYGGAYRLMGVLAHGEEPLLEVQALGVCVGCTLFDNSTAEVDTACPSRNFGCKTSACKAREDDPFAKRARKGMYVAPSVP